MRAFAEPPGPGHSTPERRRVAFESLAALEAPEATRRIGELPPLTVDLRLRMAAYARRLRLRFELCHVSTASLEEFAAQRAGDPPGLEAGPGNGNAMRLGASEERRCRS